MTKGKQLLYSVKHISEGYSTKILRKWEKMSVNKGNNIVSKWNILIKLEMFYQMWLLFTYCKTGKFSQ